MSPSNSSPKTDEKHNAIAVAMEEKSAVNNPEEGSTQEVVPERMITDERLGCGERVVPGANSVTKDDPPSDNISLTCNICDRRFSTARSLHCHQRIHRRDEDFERKLKKMNPSYSPGQGFSKKPYQGPSNDKHLGISRDPSEFIRGDGSSTRSITFPPFNSGFTRQNTNNNMAVGYPVAPYGNTSYGFSSGTLLVTHNNNTLALVSKERLINNHPTLSVFNHLGLSFGPVVSRVGGSSSGYPSLFNGQVTMAPPATPYRSLTENTSYVSSSKDRSYSPHALSLELSLGPGNDIGSSSNNNSSSQGSLSLELSLRPPNDIGSSSNSNNNSSSQGSLSLELSLGPSKSSGGSKSNSSDYPSLNGGVTGGGLTDLNMPVRPRVSRNQYHSYSPLDLITRDVPLSPPPPPTTNSPNDENDSGSSNLEKLIAIAENKVVVLDDTDDED